MEIIKSIFDRIVSSIKTRILNNNCYLTIGFQVSENLGFFYYLRHCIGFFCNFEPYFEKMG